jgi:rRNA maturation endonuclease Nob1
MDIQAVSANGFNRSIEKMSDAMKEIAEGGDVVVASTEFAQAEIAAKLNVDVLKNSEEMLEQLLRPL